MIRLTLMSKTIILVRKREIERHVGINLHLTDKNVQRGLDI